MKEIPLTRGKVALVDDIDYAVLSEYKWTAVKCGYEAGRTPSWYAVRTIRVDGRKIFIKMHHEVAKLAGLPTFPIYDHRDRNGLNNQRSNLRPSTKSQNGYNTVKKPGASSRFKWVSFNKRDGRWHVKLRSGGTVVQVGSFNDEIEAARAANKAALTCHGEFAVLNNIPDL